MNKWAAVGARRAALRLAIALVIFTTNGIARAAEPPAIVGLRVGFDSRYKLARWTPVEVTFLGGTDALAGQVRLILPDGDGTPTVVTAPRPVQLLPGRRTAVTLYAKFGRSYDDLRVQFRVDGQNVIDRPFDNHAAADGLQLPQALADQEKLIVALGGSVGVEEAARLHQQSTGVQVVIANLGGAESLPTHWYGYDGVDWLVISTGQPDRLQAMFDTAARRAALKEWIENGGKLLFTAGTEAPAVFAQDAPLAQFAPGRFVETSTLRRTTDLESFVGGSRKVRQPPGGLTLSVPRFEEIIGRIEVADGNQPLVIRSPRRFGEVVCLAVDLDRRPFPEWEGRGSLIARLIGLSEPGTNAGAAQNNAAGNAGPRRMQDLVDRMRGGLNEFVGVTPISFAVVAALILGYIVLIGPGDYFLVKRLLKRMELTWITFPIWVVLVSAGAYALAMYTKGDELRLNQVDLVDVDVQSGMARGTSWLNLFSPQSQTFDLGLALREPSGATVADSQRLLSWLGTGGTRFGGGSGALFAGQYDFSPELDTLSHVPVQVWSTKGFLGRTTFPCREVPVANLVLAADGVPEGTIRNDLKVELSQCMLLSGSWAYLLADLKPGDTVRLRPGEQRDLKHVLRHPETWKASAADASTPASALKAPESLEAMLFFKAGGSGATDNSTNSYEPFVDMSDLLDQNRAILVGYAREPAVQLTNAGQPLVGPNDLHWTVYRFVYPISKAKPATP